MTRLHGWRAKLEAHIDACRREPFAFGRHDCGLFAAGCVEAMTGSDPAAEVRGRYQTMAGALKKIRQAGFADHVDMVAGLFDEIDPPFAAVGDLAAVDGDGALAIGVVGGPHIFVPRPEGLGIVPLTSARRAWRV